MAVLLRNVLLGVGLVVALMGLLWAAQGAYLIPASFMRGPDWIAIGLAVAAAGVALVLIALRMGRPPEPTAATAPADAAASVE